MAPSAAEGAVCLRQASRRNYGQHLLPLSAKLTDSSDVIVPLFIFFLFGERKSVQTISFRPFSFGMLRSEFQICRLKLFSFGS